MSHPFVKHGKGKPLTKIAEGIEKRGTKGVFKRAAEAHGMSTKAYAEKEKHASGKTGNRARLALTFLKHRP